MGMRNRLKALALPALASFFLALGGCQTEAIPEAESVLWVKLNDSLSRYETVLVQIVDRNDSNSVLATLWNKPLPSPGTDIQPFRLKTLPDDDFIVKILGYMPAGQLALYTQIIYDGGQKSVLHKQVLSPSAKDWLTKLTPSEGALSPPFNKDTTTYTLSVAKDRIVTFSLAAEISSAVIAFNGETVPAGSPTKPITISANKDTLAINVTDISTGTASTRTYTVIVAPILPPGLYLGSLVPSAGVLSPEFAPTERAYSLMLPTGVDTVAFVLSPSDPRTMTMTVAGRAILPGQRSQTFKIEPNTSLSVPIEVYRGSELSYYQVFVELFKAPK